MSELRQGQTGRWEKVLVQPDGKILARSEWGTNYEFAPREWAALPLIEAEEATA